MHEYDGDVTVEKTETEELEDVGMTISTFTVTDMEVCVCAYVCV